MTTGVIVGRFQLPELHEGHTDFINYVRSKCDKLVFVLGESETRFTNKHPIPLALRDYVLFKYNYPEADVLELDDHPDDGCWSSNLDKILSSNAYENITLYGGRDSFLNCYSGVHKAEFYNGANPLISATEIRAKIKKGKDATPDFLRGIIYVTENKYPTVYQTVDVCLFDNNGRFLLGRKPDMKTWCFIGGFVDVKDASLEAAAEREFNEEVSGLTVTDFKYVGSLKIDDWRYRGTSDCIMTSVFVSHLPSEQSNALPIAADDLEQVRWFSLKDFDINLLGKHHHPIFEKVKNIYW